MLPILTHGKICSFFGWLLGGSLIRPEQVLRSQIKKMPYKCTEIQYVQKQIRGTKQQIN